MLDLLSTRRSVWGEIRLLASALGRQGVAGAWRGCGGARDRSRAVRRRRCRDVRRARRGRANRAPMRCRARRGRSGQLGRVRMRIRRCRWWCRRSIRTPFRERAEGDHLQSQLHHAFHDRRAGRARSGLQPATHHRGELSGCLRRRSGRIDPCDQIAAVFEADVGDRPGDVRAAVGDLGPLPAPLAMNVVPWAGWLQGRWVLV